MSQSKHAKVKTLAGFRIHPAADVFPMLAEDELAELAEDIKANGLREKIKVSDGVLIDGRNRLKACEIAGVEPEFEELNGVDPIAFILSVNINRRHLSKGQRAMATAMIYPEPGQRGRGNKSSLKEHFTKSQISYARTVLSVLPELAAQVRDGKVSLNEAYEKAQFERSATQQAEKSRLRLRTTAPDLADLVDEERMKLQEALAALVQRESDERANRESIYGLLQREEVFIRTLEGVQLEKITKTILEHPEECSLPEIKKLARRCAAAWAKLEEKLK